MFLRMRSMMVGADTGQDTPEHQPGAAADFSLRHISVFYYRSQLQAVIGSGLDTGCSVKCLRALKVCGQLEPELRVCLFLSLAVGVAVWSVCVLYR